MGLTRVKAENCNQALIVSLQYLFDRKEISSESTLDLAESDILVESL